MFRIHVTLLRLLDPPSAGGALTRLDIQVSISRVGPAGVFGSVGVSGGRFWTRYLN
jgi:hypothetical protein